MAAGDEPRSQLVIPKVSTAIRDTLVAELGTIIYDTTQNKLCFNTSSAAAATSWEKITSAAES